MVYESRITERAVVLLILFSVVTIVSTAGFRLDRFCAINCNKGRGGLLCKCNAFHFAGKRTLDSEYSQRLPTNDLFGDEADDPYRMEESIASQVIGQPDTQLTMAENLQKADDRKIKNTRMFIQWLLKTLGETRDTNRRNLMDLYDDNASTGKDLGQ